jgi:hypothetical protein
MNTICERKNIMDTRQIMQLALRLRAAKPATEEGDLAIAAWQRAVCAIDKEGLIHPDDRKAFHIVADSAGL